MSASVIYFNRGSGCCIRLLTSVFSLRKYYRGEVKLLHEGELDHRIVAVLARLNVQLVPVATTTDPVLVRKSCLWRDVTDDQTMYLDADTLVRSSVDDFFRLVDQFGFVATWFTGWNTRGSGMSRRISAWNQVAPELIEPALAYGKAINSGIMGWRKGASILPEYESLTRRGEVAGRNRLVLDEIALQLALPHHPHHTADHVWNTSGAFGDVQSARIIHYHGRKHCVENPRCDPWKQTYSELMSAFPDCRDLSGEALGDRRLKTFLAPAAPKKMDMTVVTVVDPRYAPKLKANIKRWMQLPGLKEQQFLVMVNGFKGPWERQFLKLPNVRVVRWDYDHKEVTRREFMLAAFLFGSARHVKTRYWMKLDADAVPCCKKWRWPDFEKFTIVSHRWGFTRMKSDGQASRHWFNRLDDIFSPDKPYFSRLFSPETSWVSHRKGNPDGLPMRFNSFCHIEKTEFTKRVAQHLLKHNAGRMAIPSQDTIAWYCAVLWQEPVKLMNMKKSFRN